METELRRCQANLRILGSSVIIFTAWDLLKPILLGFLVRDTDSTAVSAVSLLEDIPFGFLLGFFLSVAVMAVLVIALYFFIGLSARAEAAGKQKGEAYVILAFVFFFLRAAEYVLILVLLIRFGLPDSSLLEAGASLLVELSSIAILADLAFTAAKVRKLNKKNVE